MARSAQRHFHVTARLRKGIFHTEISLRDIAIQRIKSSGKKKKKKYSVKKKKSTLLMKLFKKLYSFICV